MCLLGKGGEMNCCFFTPPCHSRSSACHSRSLACHSREGGNPGKSLRITLILLFLTLWIPAYAGMTAVTAGMTAMSSALMTTANPVMTTVNSGITASQAAANTPIKIALEWFLNPHHAPFIIAETNGYFAAENLDVTFYPANGSQEGCRQALQGSVDFAITHEPQALIFAAKGMPLETVAVIIPETLEVILSAIPLNKTDKALLGKTLAHGSSGAGSLTFAVMHQMLKNLNLTEEDVTIILAKNCLVTGFIAGSIDVVFNLYRTYQLHDIKKHMTRPFFVYELKDFGVPTFASMVLVCGTTVPADVKAKMTRALQKAVDYIHKDPGAAYECVRHYRPELDTAENKDVWPSVHPIFAKDVTPRPSTAVLMDFLANAWVLERE
jgi:putative hydroxymethylpyrimidine transport system substrate-binding protein